MKSLALFSDLVGDLGRGVVVSVCFDHFELLRDVVVGFSEFLM